jgi:hypothetical protein
MDKLVLPVVQELDVFGLMLLPDAQPFRQFLARIGGVSSCLDGHL